MENLQEITLSVNVGDLQMEFFGFLSCYLYHCFHFNVLKCEGFVEEWLLPVQSVPQGLKSLGNVYGIVLIIIET